MIEYYGRSERHLAHEARPDRVYTLEPLIDACSGQALDTSINDAVPVRFLPLQKTGLKPLSPRFEPSRAGTCRNRQREFYSARLASVHAPDWALNSSNPLHLRSAWHSYLEQFAPIARVIITIRGSPHATPDRLVKTISRSECIFNRLILGTGWQELRNHRRQIAFLGVVEGTSEAANLHAHLALYSRQTLHHDDLKELSWQLKRRSLISEFWFEPASPHQISGYHAYVLKGFVARNGIEFSDRIYISPSLARLV